jgi:hypothetical protein
MQQRGWLTDESVKQIQLLWWFGQMIANTDMHFGNLSFFLDDALPLTPCPSYDMLPMLYRPDSSGGLPARDYQPPPPRPDAFLPWQQAAMQATVFWERVATHAQISENFRRIASANRETLLHLRERFG